MSLELRDELAARVAASLVSTLSPRDAAIRAYAVADAMLYERALGMLSDPNLEEEGDPLELGELASWTAEPRWSRADRARRDAAVADHDAAARDGAGPGLASGRPPAAADADKTATG